ncbi:LysR family transcriptional regulator [Paraburkholderia sp. BCC1885]|uniref:LysR substrate-binding domain-containing protein n=1 Tax=Paraburkholderia sp. BCC1885 TaxID=2562669 RepID=UPI0011830FE5|nr:LysR family transcriptional regulator [Paraburkholderia sp. BCC1885]
MKIDDIEAYVAVIRAQSLQQAAQALGLTQPAITRRLQNFEEALGVELLDRNTRPLRATATGRVVYEQCRVIQREIGVLRELVANDTPPVGALRLGVAQTIADIALADAMRELRAAYPDLQPSASSGWGSQLLQRVEAGELDAAAILLPANKSFAESLAARSLGRVKLAVVAPKGVLKKRVHALAECQSIGWVLNPDGCGFREGLQRALTGQGLALKLNLETLGTELQLQLVADGNGLGLVPLPLLQASRHEAKLDVLTLSDFKPLTDIWLVHPRVLGKLQQPVERFGAAVEQQFKAVQLQQHAA